MPRKKKPRGNGIWKEGEVGRRGGGFNPQIMAELVDHSVHQPQRKSQQISDFWRSALQFILGGGPEDPNHLKLRGLDFSCQFFLSDNSMWGQ